ncbi:MAG: hypothetical protein LBN32_02720 [Helicobacteraceae bacterium]|jgi:hypothetical protein|nr:hypothetical protein [Helicobacteraceae bacterium]
MEITKQGLGALNYQLNLNYQETTKQMLFKKDNSLYALEVKSTMLEFNLTVSNNTQKQLEAQNEWLRIANDLMQGAPPFPTTPEEAQEVIGENGFYGIAKTSERIAEFVLRGAGDNEELLRAGRQGVIDGFNEAEKLWGGKLPDISYQTLENALKLIDEQFAKLNLPLLKDTTA